jgi:hypothetical protein
LVTGVGLDGVWGEGELIIRANEDSLDSAEGRRDQSENDSLGIHVGERKYGLEAKICCFGFVGISRKE